jgi:hypothetical protein
MLVLFLLALLGVVLGPSPWGLAQTASLVGTWTAEEQGVRVRVVLGPDGSFSRTMTDASGTTTVHGKYYHQGYMLMVQPQGQMPMQFIIKSLEQDRLVLAGMDGSVLNMTRAAAGAPHGGTAPATGHQPAKPEPAAVTPPAAPAAAPLPTAGNGMVPNWVRPGMRLTYHLLTGSVGGSVSGYVLDEDGKWKDQYGNRYSTERQGHSSAGLVEPMVAGMDGQTVALAQPFYLISPGDPTPILKSHSDTVVTADTGGDLWMSPQKQALLMQSHPWVGTPPPGQMVARRRVWRSGNQSWNATEVVSMTAASKDYWVYDQATGHLLYLSSLSRQAPDIRDPSQTLPNSVSYATFLTFVDAQQLNLPWLGSPLPEWARRVQTISYQGQMKVQFPGSPGGPGTMLTQQLEVARRGGDWILFQSRSQTQGLPAQPGGKSITGVGCLVPLIIPPAALGRLRPGQELDRDPHTGFVTRVANVDGQSVTLQSENPRQSYLYVFDRSQGVMLHNYSQERSPGTNSVVIHEMQWVGKR